MTRRARGLLAVYGEALEVQKLGMKFNLRRRRHHPLLSGLANRDGRRHLVCVCMNHENTRGTGLSARAVGGAANSASAANPATGPGFFTNPQTITPAPPVANEPLPANRQAPVTKKKKTPKPPKAPKQK